MIPVVAALIEQGLSILGSAVLAKGQQVVEDKLGVKLPAAMTPEQAVELKKLEYQHEEWLITQTQQNLAQEAEFQKAQDANVSDRWKADMASDSWMSKNIRPIVLVYILTAFTLLSVSAGFGLKIPEAYVTLLGQWGMLIFSAYFGGRTLEKIKLGATVK